MKSRVIIEQTSMKKISIVCAEISIVDTKVRTNNQVLSFQLKDLGLYKEEENEANI